MSIMSKIDWPKFETVAQQLYEAQQALNQDYQHKRNRRNGGEPQTRLRCRIGELNKLLPWNIYLAEHRGGVEFVVREAEQGKGADIKKFVSYEHEENPAPFATRLLEALESDIQKQISAASSKNWVQRTAPDPEGLGRA